MQLKVTFDENAKLNQDQIKSVVFDVSDLEGYLLMNKLEKTVLAMHGRNLFYEQSDNIRVLIGYLLKNDVNEIYAFYDKSFDSYMAKTGNDIAKANGFNILFAVWVHIATKTLRKNKKMEGEQL